MAAIALTVNGTRHVVDADPATPLLWVLRDSLGLTGTKFGCGVAQCGACTVILEGNAVRSCVAPVARAEGKSVTTIEGLAKGDALHPLQTAFIEHDGLQCGYCTPGQIVSAVALSPESKLYSGALSRLGPPPRQSPAAERSSHDRPDGEPAPDV